MGITTRHEPSLHDVAWRDLVTLRWWEKAWELTLPWPWLAASLACYQLGWWPLGVVGSFFFFLTGLRQSHNAQHYALGIGRRAHDGLLVVLSVLMVTSMHAVQVTHLHHHRHCLDEEDVEAGHAHWPAWKALLIGPMFPLKLHIAAWRLGPASKRRWMVIEALGIAVVLGGIAFMPVPVALQWHAVAMIVGECFTGFFAVWIVHRGCDPHEHIARTQRGWLKNVLSYSMFYHLEHHLYPAVPTCHLPRLAARLDAAAPAAAERQVY